MCVQSQLEDQNTRITALESKHNAPEDITTALAEIAKINALYRMYRGISLDWR